MKKKTTITVVIFIFIWIAGLYAIYQFFWVNPQTPGPSYGSNTVRTQYIPVKINSSGEYVEIGFLEGCMPHIAAWTALCAIVAAVIIRGKKKGGSLDI